MGVTGLVRSIFFRNKSFGAHDYSNGEKKRWGSVRSYLCGDEFNSLVAVDDSGSSLLTMSQQLSSDLIIPCDSVLAIQDSASVKHSWEGEDESVSVKSSEATVTQPLQEDLDSQSQKMHQTSPISKEDAAAVTIQSAFRSYLASKLVEDTFVKEDGFSPGKLSTGTSLQVETGNSPFYRRKRASANQHKNKTQALRIKQDWDDSTVSSTIARLRSQSRIEAMTKRERALAYAFSQQLRICSKNKQIDACSKDESNIGWSWLERWMATRVPDSISIEPRTNTQTNVASIKNRHFVLTGELESCASNDLPLQISETDDFQREKSSLKAGIAKRKPAPSYKTQTRHRIQATKRDLQQQTKKAKKARPHPQAARCTES